MTQMTGGGWKPHSAKSLLKMPGVRGRIAVVQSGCLDSRVGTCRTLLAVTDSLSRQTLLAVTATVTSDSSRCHCHCHVGLFSLSQPLSRRTLLAVTATVTSDSSRCHCHCHVGLFSLSVCVRMGLLCRIANQDDRREWELEQEELKKQQKRRK